jgi:hypothetical protein
MRLPLGGGWSAATAVNEIRRASDFAALRMTFLHENFMLTFGTINKERSWQLSLLI